MTRMTIKEMQERLILYKMVREVLEKNKHDSNGVYCKSTSPWLYNICESRNMVYILKNI
jgi:hypothetical protein